MLADLTDSGGGHYPLTERDYPASKECLRGPLRGSNPPTIVMACRLHNSPLGT